MNQQLDRISQKQPPPSIIRHLMPQEGASEEERRRALDDCETHLRRSEVKAQQDMCAILNGYACVKNARGDDRPVGRRDGGDGGLPTNQKGVDACVVIQPWVAEPKANHPLRPGQLKVVERCLSAEATVAVHTYAVEHQRCADWRLEVGRLAADQAAREGAGLALVRQRMEQAMDGAVRPKPDIHEQIKKSVEGSERESRRLGKMEKQVRDGRGPVYPQEIEKFKAAEMARRAASDRLVELMEELCAEERRNAEQGPRSGAAIEAPIGAEAGTAPAAGTVTEARTAPEAQAEPEGQTEAETQEQGSAGTAEAGATSAEGQTEGAAEEQTKDTTGAPDASADDLGLPADGELVVLARGPKAQRILISNVAASSRHMGGAWYPRFRRIVLVKEKADAEGKCVWCELPLVEGVTDPDLRHAPECPSYLGKKPHIHGESCLKNPLCPAFFQPPAPPAPEAPRPEPAKKIETPEKPKKPKQYRWRSPRPRWKRR